MDPGTFFLALLMLVIFGGIGLGVYLFGGSMRSRRSPARDEQEPPQPYEVDEDDLHHIPDERTRAAGRRRKRRAARH